MVVGATVVAVGNATTAASQNEVLITTLYDGTANFDDGSDPGYPDDPLGFDTPQGAPEPHTPGLDKAVLNGVLRTWDTAAFRVDWNINEDAATNAILTLVLPDHARFEPDVTGMFPGCDPALSSFPTPQTLVCHLGDHEEGSNGTIRPIFVQEFVEDGTVYTVDVTLTTDDDAAGVVDTSTPFTVSEAPKADWVKHDPEPLGGPFDTTGDGNDDGYLFLYPITLSDYHQNTTPILGMGPILDSVPLDIWDHAWGITGGTTLATQAQLDIATGGGRTACGNYDGVGEYPITSGTWTCGAPTAPNGYPVVPITIAGHDTEPAPPLNADGATPNEGTERLFPDGIKRTGVVALAGQIAVYVPIDDFNAAIADANNDSPTSAWFFNTITSRDDSVEITSEDDVEPDLIAGNGGFTPELATVGSGESPNNNTRRHTVGIGTTGGGSPGATIGHNINFLPGPLQLLETNRWAPSRIGADLRLVSEGGMYLIPGSNFVQGNSSQGDFIGRTPRGAVVTIDTQVFTAATPNTGTTYNAPIHGCTAFDTTHYNISAYDAPIVVTEIDGSSTGNGNVVQGGYSIPANAGPLAHVVTGTEARSMYNTWRGQLTALGGDELPFRVQFTDAPILDIDGMGKFGVDQDQLTCNNDDVGDSGVWVDSDDLAGLAQFDTVNPGDGIYEGITRARVSITENFPWESTSNENVYSGFKAYFQATVKTDLAVQTVAQELFAVQSHSFGALGANGVPDLVRFPGDTNPTQTCQPYSTAQWQANLNPVATDTGWCNHLFADDGANSLDTGDQVDWDNNSWTRSTTNPNNGVTTYYNASGTVIQIVEAALAISKVNVDGLGDVKDNGQIVEFEINPKIVGSNQEALTNVRVTDTLPAYYEFNNFVTQPTGPGASCTESGGAITCQFSEPNPAVDTGPLPPGLPGGWEDSFIISVTVTGAVANPDSPTVLTNTAVARSSALGPWNPALNGGLGDFSQPPTAASKVARNSARSFMPLPADQGAIVKTVDALDGPCTAHPTLPDLPDDWELRCSRVGHDDNMTFLLSLSNEGNTEFGDIEFIDVFPHNADATEEDSYTNTQGVTVPTQGDGRDPASSYTGTLAFVSAVPGPNFPAGATLTTWVTGDDPLTVSRDPAASLDPATGNTWCDAPGGTPVGGDLTGSCPADATLVTASYSVVSGAPLGPNETVDVRLTLDPEDSTCNDFYTNTFGARVDQILLPIRSNDVTIQIECDLDLALEKVIDPDFVPGADWATPGTTVVPFLIEVTNQGDPIEDFDITDYVDTTTWSFDVANNPDGTSLTTGNGTVALPYTWDVTDPAKPVVTVDGRFDDDEVVVIAVNLTLIGLPADMENLAEISKFDTNGDPTDGDSDPANPDNPSTGALVDIDSTPDDEDGNGPGEDLDQDMIDGETGEDGTDGGDEDDHDIAEVPIFDLELVKTFREPVSRDQFPWHATFDVTVSNQGNQDVFLVGVTEYAPAGTSYDAAATAALWAAEGVTGVTDASPVFTIAGPIAAGDFVTFPVVFDIDDMTLPAYENAAEISSFDDNDDPADTPGPFVIDIDSTPDGSNDDDVIDQTEPGYDPDGDGNLNEPTDGDEDDHDIAPFTLPFDQALTKTLSSATSPLLPDGSVTMLLTVTNQGGPITSLDLTDTLDPGQWAPFDLALNAAGPVDATSTAAAAYEFVWDDGIPSAPVATLTPTTPGDLFVFGETLVVPITIQISPDFDPALPLLNVAEISNFDDDDDPANGDASTGDIEDVDSTPDGDPATGPGETVGGDLVDDDIDGDGTPGTDEDDHDISILPIYDLELVKTVAGPVDVSTDPPTGTYTITVSNQGNQDAFLVEVTEYLPVGITMNTADTDAGLPAGVTRTSATTFEIAGPIAPGDVVTFDLEFDIDDIVASPYVNGAEISSFDDNDDPADDVPAWVVDIDSTPDGVNDDDLIDQTESGYDPDGDGNLNEATAGDEDDHDIAVLELPFDLALRKRVDPDDPDLDDGLQNGEVITFFIEVFNEGRDVDDFDVIDYIGSGWTFDPAENPDATTLPGSLGGPALPFTWTTPTPDPTALVDGVLGTSESIIIPVNLTATVLVTTDELFNTAEIARFDSDGDPTNGDSDPLNAGNPDDGPLVDIDSTPDAKDDDPRVDDVIDGTDGDEDDHDFASTKWYDLALVKDLSVGESIELDPDNPVISFDITVSNQGPHPVTNVSVADTPPAPLTLSGDNPGSFTDPVSGAIVTYNGDGTFTIDGLAVGATVTFPVIYDVDLLAIDGNTLENTAEITAFEDEDGERAADIDSFPNNDTGDDLYVDGEDGDEADGGEDVNADTDGDGSLHTLNLLDEDDHDREIVQFLFDQALVKTLVSVDSPLVPGGQVTMNLTIINQGARVETISITDYLDPALWAPFDAALNADGAVDASSTAGAAYGFVWDDSDPQAPVANLAPITAGDTLAIGETLVVPVTVTVADDFDTSTPLVNAAEISNFDDDGDPTNGDADPDNPDNPDSGPLTDRDSTPDEDNDDPVVDDVTDGTGGDEDDHDITLIPVYDLALRKSVDPSTSFPVFIGSDVTFQIEVFNQGTVDATDPSVIDYIDPAMFDALDLAANPAGTTGGDASLGYTWSDAGGNAAVDIVGVLAPGESVTVSITLTIAAGADLASLSNTAEITGGTPTGPDGEVVTYPGGGPIEDADSTPDDVNDDPAIDDEISTYGANGDEDDHDFALVMPPTYNLGNQVWSDANNDGQFGADEDPIADVVVDLFVDADGDGQPDDTNGDGVIDGDDAIATTTTDADGGYLFEDLPAGDYIVGLNPSNFAADGPLAGSVSSVPTEVNADGNVDDDDNGFNGPDGYIISGPITLFGAEPSGETGLDNDPGHPDSLSNLTVDFGIWTPNFDLALTKTYTGPSEAQVGDSVTFDIEVVNQGDVSASNISVVDYLPSQLTLNDSDWTADGSNAVIMIAGPLAPGESVVVEITVIINEAGPIVNRAEIGGGTPLFDDGTPLVGPNGLLMTDGDSVPSNNAIGELDEDDVGEVNLVAAEVPVVVPPAPPVDLPDTGSSLGWLLQSALVALLLGGMLFLITRRRRERESPAT